jgi:hypothetical protein
MAKTNDTTTPKPSDLDTLLGLATSKTKDALGDTPTNVSAETNLTMTASVTQNGDKTSTVTTAGVSLGTQTTTAKADATSK